MTEPDGNRIFEGGAIFLMFGAACVFDEGGWFADVGNAFYSGLNLNQYGVASP